MQQWSLGLRQNLISKKFVCELHFHDDDVIKKDTVPIVNEEDFDSNRIKCMLKRNAIPTLNAIKTSAKDVINLPPKKIT